MNNRNAGQNEIIVNAVRQLNCDDAELLKRDGFIFSLGYR
jgi:hypothetical protein